MTVDERTRVLIIGGGPVGLTLAGLLGRAGVPNVVVERRTDVQGAPAAHVLRNTPRAVLALLGIDERITEVTPPLAMERITWCTTLTGQEIGHLDLRRPGDAAAPWTNVSQNLLEPILRDVVTDQDTRRLLTGTTCVDVHQDEHEVAARVVRPDGTEQVLRADWLVVAEGAGSATRRALGIDMVGDGPLAHFHMVHVRADLRPWIEHRPGPVVWIMHPEVRGALIVHDVRRSHVLMLPASGEATTPTDPRRRLDAALELPAGVDVEILATDTWTAFNQVAERYRQGRVLLCGDAAHRFPPTGGLGLNTGILEAHDLALRLIALDAGEADPSLLDGYDADCRPVATANATTSLHNAITQFEIDERIGSTPDRVALDRRLETMSTAERSALQATIDAQRDHYLYDGEVPPSAADLVPTAAPGRIRP